MDPTAASACVTPRRKRTWEPGSITNAFSSKRRRISMASVDLPHEITSIQEFPSTSKVTLADRFIAAPQEAAPPLTITPRSHRIARSFGLAKDRILNFADSSGSTSSKELNMQRMQFSTLFATTAKISPTSCLAHLGRRKHFVLALDGPGIPPDPLAYPISWSSRNSIAVACGRDLYYQNLGTRVITHLCGLGRRRHGRFMSIAWSHDASQTVALGTDTGFVQLWDADEKAKLQEWRTRSCAAVGGMDWRGNLLAVGAADGTLELFDARQPGPVGRLTAHISKVLGVKWSPDGDYLATGDQHGVVQIWDARAGRAPTNASRKGSKMKHNQAPVKALAWCPWKPSLLATGTTYPDGRIRIWNVNDTSSTVPMQTIKLNTSVTSLIWSPHCKELLSTHGTSWVPRSASTPDLRDSANVLPSGAFPTRTMFTNSITVHAYPSLTHLMSVPAHSAAVGHSCLSPDGTMIFTICPAEEAMKMWKVWGVPESKGRRESVFDKCAIR